MSFAKDLLNRYNLNEKNTFVSMEGKTLRIELTNICNDKCICCPNRLMHRKKIQMDRDLAMRILREGKEGGCKEVGLFINGEPFMTPGFEDYVKYSKELGYDWVFYTTNGAYATPERVAKTMEFGVDSIKFSINAGCRETYKMVHGADDFDKVIDNLKAANETRKRKGYRVRLLASCVVTKYIQDEVDSIYNLLTPYVDDIVFFKAESFGGQIDDIESIRPTKLIEKVPQYAVPNKLPCPELFKTVCVTAEGYLTLCCDEAFNNLVIEDLHEKSLMDAWNSPSMQDMRRRHLEGNVKGTLCQRCIFGEGEYEPLNKDLFIKSNTR